MSRTDSVTLLIAFATMYIALVAVIFAVAPLQYPSRFLVRQMRHLRVFTIAVAMKLALELLQIHGTDLRQFLQLPVREVAEVVVGALLVYLLWRTNDQFYELEQAARKFESVAQP